MKKAGILSMLAFSAFGPLSGQQQTALNQVNSVYDEQHPVLAENGDLYFSRGFHPQNKGGQQDVGDVWVSKSDPNGGYAAPMHLKSLSTKGNDVVVGFLNPTQILVYHDGSEKKQGIHQYRRQGGDWEYERVLEMGNFRNKSTHFSGRLDLSAKVMILTLESFGSYGNEDVYVSFRNDDDTWTSPKNLGPTINTYRQEMTPSLSPDNQTLFFSTNGHGGEGGRNIFHAQRLDDTWQNWSKPVPVGEVNSPGVELGFVMNKDGEKALYTTTQNSEGFGDIMVSEQVEVERLVVEVEKVEEEEQVQEAETISSEVAMTTEVDEPLVEERVLDLKAMDIHTKEILDFTLSAKRSGEQKQIDSQEIQGLSGNDLVTVASAGYLPVTLSQKELLALDAPVMLTPVASGSRIVLEDITFSRGTAELADEQSLGIIEELARFLEEHPEVRVRLEGHTDNLGDPQLNKELSMNRAGKIRNLLAEKGIAFERLRVLGWGGTRPVASNQTEEGRNKNRRVEMIIE